MSLWFDLGPLGEVVNGESRNFRWAEAGCEGLLGVFLLMQVHELNK